jgi:hypothetical protein
VRLAIRDASGVTIWDPEAVVGTDPDASTVDSRSHREGWQRLLTTFITPEGMERCQPVIVVGGGASDEFRLDAAQLEEGSYASPWTPGFLGPQVILDKGGFAVDASKGGFFRLAGSSHVPGDRNVVELYQKGLRFANDTEISSPATGVIAINNVPLSAAGTAFPVSPATNDRFFRTDLSMEFFWNGTRWLSTTLFERELRNTEAGAGRAQPYAATQGSAMRGGLPNSSLWLERVVIPFIVSSGGTALSGSHKWDVDFLLDPSATTVGTTTINSGASNTWREANTAIGVVVAATDFEVSMTITKTGTPGDLRVFPQFMYRRIAT